MHQSWRASLSPQASNDHTGFRIASRLTPVPEPTTTLLLAASTFTLLLRRRF